MRVTTSKLAQSGFTLMEMLMVIVLVGILAAVAMPNFISFNSDAKIAVTKSRLNELRVAIIGDPRQVSNGTYLSPGFLNQVGSVPTALTDLTTQGAYPAYDPFKKVGWNGPYVNATAEPNWNRDAWGITFTYSSATRTITSCGPNKTCGNADDISVNF